MNDIQPNTEASPSYVIDVDTANFERDVIERSKTIPVLVDFWAEWCEPCKTLGPRLEKAAREGNGRFVLAKVDIDKNGELATAFRVQGVPMVIALKDGRLVDGFQGALGERELEAFLSQIAPPLEAGPVELARDLFDQGQASEAIELLRAHLRVETTDDEARILMARMLIKETRLDEAQKVIAKISAEALEKTEGKALAAQLALAQNAGDVDKLAAEAQQAPEDPAARLAYGRALIAAQEFDRGLSHMLESHTLDATHADGAAKKAMLEVFEVLGLEDPIANDYRYKLSLLLFS